MKLFVLVSILFFSSVGYAGACYFINTQMATDLQKNLTLRALEKKEKKILEEVENYKKALEIKKKRMIKMLKLMKGTEALMKKNQIERKKILKYWKDVVKIHTITE